MVFDNEVAAMAHERYIRTNQKLYFAGLSLANWQRAEASAVANVPGLVQAEREACLFHLYGALLGLCHEIAGYYRLPGADEPHVELLLKRLPEDDAPSPELSELRALAEQPRSWLAQLLAAYAALFEPPRAPIRGKVDPGLSRIEAVSVDDEAQPLSAGQLQAWRQQLKALILRHREALTEW